MIYLSTRRGSDDGGEALLQHEVSYSYFFIVVQYLMCDRVCFPEYI